MKLHKYLFPCHLVLAVLAGPAFSETYNETIECVFKKAREDRPTPTRVVFSTEENDRAARLHEVDIPGLRSPAGTARIRRNSGKILSIAWSGEKYVFLETGNALGKSASAYSAVNLLNHEFSLFLDRRTMTAKVRSHTLLSQRPKEGQSTGSCKIVKTPRGVNSTNTAQATLTVPQVASSKMTGIKSYKCKLNSREERGWIPEEIVFSIDAGKARARAYGPIIHQAKEQPVDVGFKTTRNGEYQMNWKLSLSSASTHRYRLGYTAVFDPKTNRIKMRARFLSMDTSNRPKGQGNCVVLNRHSLF